MLQTVHDACPAGKCEKVGLDHAIPIGFRNAESVQHRDDHAVRIQPGFRLATELASQVCQMLWKNRPTLREQCSYAMQKPLLPVRHRPVSHALIEKRSAKPDQ